MNINFKWFNYLSLVVFSVVFSGTVLAGKMEDERNEVLNAIKNKPRQEQLRVVRELSASGNSIASYDLYFFHSDEELAKAFGIKVDPNEAQRFARLAYMQGNEEVVKDPYHFIKLTKPYEPGIGMSKAQVIDSSWGDPKDKLKTTTQNGTTEMWVYHSNSYVLFDTKGYVVKIQEQ